MTPFFSVIIPLFNRENFITPTIQSVLNQTCSDFEVIVVDDFSTDNSVAVVEAISDSRVRIIKQPFNQERGAARNKGFEESKGKYICFLDSDDFFKPNHLATFFAEIEKRNEPKCLFFSNSYMDDGKSKYKKEVPLLKDCKKEVPLLKDYNVFEYILHYTFHPARTCVHRDVINDFKFDASISGIEDLDLWLRIATKYDVIQLQEYTSIYNLHDEQYTFSDSKRHEKELVNFKTVFNKTELKGKLPQEQINKHFAQSHYFISLKSKGFLTKFKHSFLSYKFYPKGYNENSNKAMFVNCLYSFPVIGYIVKSIVRALK